MLMTLGSVTTHASIFASVATSGWKTIAPSIKYKLDTRGYDIRVYEWTPAHNDNISCVFVSGSENSTGVACYDKRK